MINDFGLTETQREFKQLAADFVNAEIVPRARDWDRQEEVDRSIVKQLGDLGFLGLAVPEEYGGIDADMVSYTLVSEELGRGDSSVRGIMSVSLGLVTKTIVDHGTEEQKQRWVPSLVAGDIVGCFGLTEPGTGSDASALTTRAVRDGDDWIITGNKMFITNGTWAAVAIIFARTEQGITAFLVPTDSHGFEARRIHGKLGLRGQDTAELALDNVRVPDSARLGDVGRGLGIALSTLARGRVTVAAGAVGVAQAALDAAITYTSQRTQFGVTIDSFQLVQDLIAQSAVDVQAARLLTLHVAAMVDAGIPPKEYTVHASVAKFHASEAAVRVTNNCLQVFGGYGYIDEYPVAKYMRDARVLALYEGTSQVQKLIIARDLTGVDAMTPGRK